MTTYPHTVTTQLRPRTTHSLDATPPPPHPHSRCSMRSINKSTLTETEKGSALKLQNSEEMSARTWQSGRLFLTNARETGDISRTTSRGRTRGWLRGESLQRLRINICLSQSVRVVWRDGWERGHCKHVIVDWSPLVTSLSHDVRNSCRRFCSGVYIP